MALLKIAQIGEPVLRQRAAEINKDEIESNVIQTLIDDMIDTMHDANGAGIAANQVYRALRICIIETKGNNPRYPYKPAIPLTVMINPIIEPLGDDKFDNIEGCLSVPNLRGLVPRHAKISLQYLDRHGATHNEEYYGVSAGTFQHECDHLDGKLFVDRVSNHDSLTTLDNFLRHHEQAWAQHASEIVQRYGG